MKYLLLSLFLAALTSNAFPSEYEEVMAANIEKMYQSTTAQELTNLANQFQRIANVEKDKWEPVYYTAYCHVRVIFFAKLSSKETHKQLDQAQKQIDALFQMAKKEPEVYILQALVYQLRITDPTKGYKYSKLSNEALTKAEKLDADNPRIYYLRGSNTFHTPKMFGGGKEKAKPLLQKAADIFETQKAVNRLAPTWGSHHNNELLKQCLAEKE